MKYTLVISAVLLINLIQNYSQLKDSNNALFSPEQSTNSYLYEGNNILGPVIGYSVKSKVLNYGINYEHAFNQNHIGIFTIGITGKFSILTEDIFDNSARLKTTNIIFGVNSKFNLNSVSSKSLIPFAGMLLGYNNSVTKYTFNDNSVNPGFQNSTKHMLYLFAEAGLRYFISEKTAIVFRLGSGNIGKSVLEFELDYKF